MSCIFFKKEKFNHQFPPPPPPLSRVFSFLSIYGSSPPFIKETSTFVRAQPTNEKESGGRGWEREGERERVGHVVRYFPLSHTQLGIYLISSQIKRLWSPRRKKPYSFQPPTPYRHRQNALNAPIRETFIYISLREREIFPVGWGRWFSSSSRDKRRHKKIYWRRPQGK